MGRILRLSKIIQFLKSTDDVKATLLLFKLVLYLVLYMHCFTCIWWMLVSNSDTLWMPPMYMEYPERYYIVYDQDIGSQYLCSFHTIVGMLMGGDALPKNVI